MPETKYDPNAEPILKGCMGCGRYSGDGFLITAQRLKRCQPVDVPIRLFVCSACGAAALMDVRPGQKPMD